MQPGQTTDPSQQTPPESQQQPLSESNPMPEQQFNQRQMAPESTQLQTVDMTQPASESLAVQETSQEAIQNSGDPTTSIIQHKNSPIGSSTKKLIPLLAMNKYLRQHSPYPKWNGQRQNILPTRKISAGIC